MGSLRGETAPEALGVVETSQTAVLQCDPRSLPDRLPGKPQHPHPTAIFPNLYPWAAAACNPGESRRRYAGYDPGGTSNTRPAPIAHSFAYDQP